MTSRIQRTLLLVASAWAASAAAEPAMIDGVKVSPADARTGLLCGTSVAVGGKIAAVGASFDANGNNGQAGSVFVYVQDGASWPQQIRLLADDDQVGDNLGSYVEVQDNEVFAGAPPHTKPGGTNAGAVYVFARDGNGAWTQAQELVPDPAIASGRFGQRFAVQNDRLLVNGKANGGQQVVYEFSRLAGVWTQTGSFAPLQGGNFGSHIALDQNVAVVGAASAPNDAAVTSGVAYVFNRGGDGLWTQTARLQAPDGAAGDQFGFSVSIWRDTAVVGAYQDNVGSFADQGSAHVFKRGPGGWAFLTTLLAPDGIGGDGFGKDVRICENRVYVGASNRSEGVNSQEGVVYRWDYVGGVWTYMDKFTLPAPGLSSALFGDHLGIGANALIVGAPFKDRAFVYDGGCAVDAVFGDHDIGSFE
jgi:hypothetical protein